MKFQSIPGVCSLSRVDGADADPSRAPDLVVELPHGATRTSDYDALRARLRGAYPADLVDFFHVNTDVGSPELGEAVAAAFVAAAPTRSVVLVRSCIPRTYIDCNRVIDVDPSLYAQGGVTPGVPPWVVDPFDLTLLRGIHAAYVEAASATIDLVCRGGGVALLLHTYAPRSVDVQVDADIVRALRAAWAPDRAPSWPLRPDVDVIGRTLQGEPRVPPEVLAGLVSDYAALGLGVADSATYPIHPSTWAWHHDLRYPGRVLCIEVRRDHLAAPWDPFVEMRIDTSAAGRLAPPIARALEALRSAAE